VDTYTHTSESESNDNDENQSNSPTVQPEGENTEDNIVEKQLQYYGA